MKNFTQIPNWITINKDISDSSFRTYVVLKSFKFGSNDPFPSQATLSELRFKSKKSIIEHLKALKKLELIDYKKRGFSSSNKYQFIGEENHTNDSEEFVMSEEKITSLLNSQNLQPNNTELNKTKTNNLRGDKDPFKKEQELSEIEVKLINEIVKWNTYPVFNTSTPENTIRIQATNTVKKHGHDKIRQIFDRTANTYSPHPRDFWNEIKGLKGEF